MSEIFVSYAREDRPRVQRLADVLATQGWSVWWDRLLDPGTPFDRVIERKLEEARCVVVVWSRTSVESNWVRAEAGDGLARGILIPVRVDSAALPLEFRRIETADLSSHDPDEVSSQLERFVKGVRRVLEGSPDASTSVGHPDTPPVIPLDAVSPAAPDPFGPDGGMNSHVWTLKNGRHVRMVGHVVKNDGNVHDTIVRREIEANAWRYNRCYDQSFGHLSSELPAGTVIIDFDILDQLPRNATVARSDFTDDRFNACVVATLLGQTLNMAGRNGTGHVAYAFKFLPN
jgi:hypothetical protein